MSDRRIEKESQGRQLMLRERFGQLFTNDGRTTPLVRSYLSWQL